MQEPSKQRTPGGPPERAGRRGAIALVLLACAGAFWFLTAREPAERPLQAQAPAPTAVSGHGDAQVLAPPADARREAPAPPPGPDPLPEDGSAPEAALVRVHGHVQQGGLPAVVCDLAFRRLDERGLAGDEADWDLTDEHGRYEVRLPPAAYLITSEEAGSQPIRMLVPGDRDELVLDLVLPPPPPPGAR